MDIRFPGSLSEKQKSNEEYQNIDALEYFVNQVFERKREVRHLESQNVETRSKKCRSKMVEYQLSAIFYLQALSFAAWLLWRRRHVDIQKKTR